MFYKSILEQSKHSKNIIVVGITYLTKPFSKERIKYNLYFIYLFFLLVGSDRSTVKTTLYKSHYCIKSPGS